MTAQRSQDFRIEDALRDAGFTPRVRDLPRLVELLAGEEETALLAVRAIARVGLGGARAAMSALEAAEPRARHRLVDAVARVAAQEPADELFAFLARALGDPDPRARKAAARGLGAIRPAGASASLAAALAAEQAPEVRRALVAALGKTGGPEALAALRAERGREAPEEGVHGRATIMLTRTIAREQPSLFLVDRPAQAPIAVSLRCRRGLASILESELPLAWLPSVANPRFGPRVEATLKGAPAELFRARTMTGFGFPLRVIRLADDGELASAVADAIAGPEARRIFSWFTRGPIRYRLAWAQGGKRRAAVWRCAEEVSRRCPELINDPTESTWEVVVHEYARDVLIELCPRTDDPRFRYRKEDVPAASHPTIAAALVHAGGVGPEDVVWDPFAGSGTELCERALAGPYRALIGSDASARAIAKARVNLEAAGAQNVELVEADSLVFAPEAPTLVVTNPPMGRRVLRGANVGGLLDKLVEHVAKVLAPGGRFVWMSPMPARTTPVAERAGLVCELRLPVDMGGFDADLERWSKPTRPREAPPPAVSGTPPRSRRRG